MIEKKLLKIFPEGSIYLFTCRKDINPEELSLYMQKKIRSQLKQSIELTAGVNGYFVLASPNKFTKLIAVRGCSQN